MGASKHCHSPQGQVSPTPSSTASLGSVFTSSRQMRPHANMSALPGGHRFAVSGALIPTWGHPHSPLLGRNHLLLCRGQVGERAMGANVLGVGAGETPGSIIVIPARPALEDNKHYLRFLLPPQRAVLGTAPLESQGVPHPIPELGKERRWRLREGE